MNYLIETVDGCCCSHPFKKASVLAGGNWTLRYSFYFLRIGHLTALELICNLAHDRLLTIVSLIAIDIDTTE